MVASASAVASAASSADLSTTSDTSSLELIDMRLNQNIFVGLAVEKLRISPETSEEGKTLLMALLGWVPRIVWPDKPERGKNDFISLHTDRVFSETATFGAGPIFEFYVNYGYSGVFFGFFVWGAMVRLLDVASGRALAIGATGRFAKWTITGIAMMQPLAELFFILGSTVAAFLVGEMMWRVFWKPAAHRRTYWMPGASHGTKFPLNRQP